MRLSGLSFGGLVAMTLVDVNRQFSADDKCRELLKRLRWPEGVQCLRCKSKKVGEVHSFKYECYECHYQFTVTAQTIFHDSHLPLPVWFMAVLLIVEARKGVSANQLKRTLGVAYKTAWYLCHRIRHAMQEVDRVPLGGVIEMDETFVGGRAKPGTKKYDSKTPVIGIRQRGGELRFFKAEDITSGTLAKYIKENIDPAAVEMFVTDEWAGYPKAAMAAGLHGSKHETIKHKDHVYAIGDVYTNTVESAFSLLKRGIVGSWHQVSDKHLPAYLNEMTFRFNRRKNSDIFMDTLKHMVTADPLTFEELTA